MLQGGREEYALKNVRVWFKKEGTARYISHLDLNRSMLRIIHRAKLPIWYTEGFNQHAFITFALPLSLGFGGMRESMDFKLLDDEMPFEEIKNRLNKCLPQGIVVYDVTEPQMKPGRISYALFNMKLSCPGMSASKLEETVKKLFSMDEIMMDKKSKAGIKEVDLKENICKYDISAKDNCVDINIILPAGSTNNVNPTLITDALKKYFGVEVDYDIVRLDIYNENVESFK